jgi:hypothetical protein
MESTFNNNFVTSSWLILWFNVPFIIPVQYVRILVPTRKNVTVNCMMRSFQIGPLRLKLRCWSNRGWWDVRGYGLVGPGSISGRTKYFSSPQRSNRLTQLPIQWVQGAISLWVKPPGHEADYSLPSSAEFKKFWSCTFTPPYVFRA